MFLSSQRVPQDVPHSTTHYPISTLAKVELALLYKGGSNERTFNILFFVSANFNFGEWSIFQYGCDTPIKAAHLPKK
jgi:hypothetical protein